MALALKTLLASSTDSQRDGRSAARHIASVVFRISLELCCGIIDCIGMRMDGSSINSWETNSLIANTSRRAFKVLCLDSKGPGRPGTH